MDRLQRIDPYKIRESRIRSALRDQFRNGHVFRCDEVFMLEMLDQGLIGMDGFKFCEVEEAKRNRELMVRSLNFKQKETPYAEQETCKKKR